MTSKAMRDHKADLVVLLQELNGEDVVSQEDYAAVVGRLAKFAGYDLLDGPGASEVPARARRKPQRAAAEGERVHAIRIATKRFNTMDVRSRLETYDVTGLVPVETEKWNLREMVTVQAENALVRGMK
ncbi:MAG: hypothetical protein AAGH15_05250 [Myxococcota bacterium]